MERVKCVQKAMPHYLSGIAKAKSFAGDSQGGAFEKAPP